MSEYIDVYIDTTTKVPEDATEFDYELFGRFMSGGPWVAHSEYMKLQAENARLRELCADLYAEMITYSNAPNYNASVWAPKLRELGVEP